MPLSINTNVASLTAQRAMLNSNAGLETSFERLSTGKRINSASDDAAGLAIGKDLESRVSGLNQAIRNVNDGISMVQIAEGALDEVTSILQRMRDLAVQAANGSLSSTERGYLDAEQSKLATTLGSVIDQSQFNGTDLVDDSSATPITIQAGADASDTTSLSFAAMTENTLGVDATQIDLTTGKAVFTTTGTPKLSDADLTALKVTVGGVVYTDATQSDISTTAKMAARFAHADFKAADNTKLSEVLTAVSSGAGTGDTITFTAVDGNQELGSTLVIEISSQAGGADGTLTPGNTVLTTAGGFGIKAIDDALATVASERATLGATQAQLESTVRNLANVAENTSAAAGRIMDTDYAAETANLTKAQILQQAATSILAQANAQPQVVLSLLQ
jgi:flagellin